MGNWSSGAKTSSPPYWIGKKERFERGEKVMEGLTSLSDAKSLVNQLVRSATMGDTAEYYVVDAEGTVLFRMHP